ncbi:helix-turn-helix domain-containing protein [soil metagenome]
MKPARYLCPVDAPLQVLGGKWKLIICFYLSQQPRRNGELRRLMPVISQKMLTQQLRQLETDGIVQREVVDRVPPKVIYSLRPEEVDHLAPVLAALCAWGFYWADKTGIPLEAVGG